MVKTKPKVFVRTIFNLGDFNDHTHTGSKSLTDPSDNLSTEQLLHKLLTGESVSARYVPEFDVDPSMSEEEAFKTLDITKSGNFDLADVVHLKHQAIKNKSRKDKIEEQIKASQNEELVKSKSATADETPVTTSIKGGDGKNTVK